MYMHGFSKSGTIYLILYRQDPSEKILSALHRKYFPPTICYVIMEMWFTLLNIEFYYWYVKISDNTRIENIKQIFFFVLFLMNIAFGELNFKCFITSYTSINIKCFNLKLLSNLKFNWLKSEWLSLGDRRRFFGNKLL